MSATIGGRRTLAALLGLALLGTGCGLKPSASRALGPAEIGAGAQEPAETAGTGASAGGGDVAGGAAGGGATAPDDGSPGAAGPGGAAVPGAPGGAGPARPGDPAGPGSTVGIDFVAKVIHLGVHAPLTGVSPLSREEIVRGVEAYWRTRRVFDEFTVRVRVADDTGKPSGAVAACRDLARDSFAVVGVGSPDTVDACARDRALAASGTPYLSLGSVLDPGTATYRAVSLGYAAQAPYVVASARRQGFLNATNARGERKWALVLPDTPRYADTRVALERALAAAGVAYRTFATPRDATDSDAVTLGADLRAYDAPVVFVLTSPSYFVKMLTQTGRGYAPIWTGVGVTLGVNSVVGPACSAAQGAFDGRFLSPYPGLDRASAAFAAEPAVAGSDTGLMLWALSGTLHGGMEAMGRTRMGRASFLAAVDRAWRGGPAVFPPSRFGVADRLSGDRAWQLRSDCSSRRFVTVGSAPISP